MVNNGLKTKKKTTKANFEVINLVFVVRLHFI